MASELSSENCFVCRKESEIFNNTSESTELNIRQIICLHFWFTEDDLQSATVCEICWEKIDQFHKFYLDVQRIHGQLKTASSSDSIKQEDTDVEEDQLREKCIDLHGDDPEPFDMVDCKLEETVEESKESEEEESSPQEPPKKRKYTRRMRDETNAKAKDIEQHKSTLEEKRKATDDFIKQHTVYFCEECNLKFETFRTIRRHRWRTHKKKTIVCCGTQYKTPAALYEHVQNVLNPEAFKCELCGNTFKSHSGYLRHKRDNHAATKESPVTSFQCHRCEKSFAKELILKAHLRNHETLDEGTVKCEFCGKCFGNKRFLRNHLKNVHQKDPDFVCEFCSKGFAIRSAFLAHHKMHELTAEEQRKQCPVCNKWLKNQKYWRKHVQRHKEEGKDYKCDECSHVSINMNALKTHIRYKHAPDKKRHVCEVCGKEYSRPGTLREHVANAHTGEPLYRCQFCEKQFFSNATMYAHRKKEHPQEWLENHLAKYATAEESPGETLS